ncbi:MAG: hypothetical protein ACPLVG_06440 [Pseudothermotoga sp.]
MGLSRFLLSLSLSRKQLQIWLRQLEQPFPSKKVKGVIKAAVVQMDYIPVSGIGGFVTLINHFLVKMRDFSPQIIVFPHLMDTIFYRTFPIFLFSRGKRYARMLKECSVTTSRTCEKVMAEISKVWHCSVIFGTTQGLFVYNEGVRQESIFEVQDYKVAVLPKRLLTNSWKLKQLVDDGVRIVSAPGFGLSDYREWDDRFHMWAHSQMIGFYGLWSAMSGKFLGQDLKARASVTAPIPITNSLDGYIVKNNSLNGDTVLLAELDMFKLESFIQARNVPVTYNFKGH